MRCCSLCLAQAAGLSAHVRNLSGKRLPSTLLPFSAFSAFSDREDMYAVSRCGYYYYIITIVGNIQTPVLDKSKGLLPQGAWGFGTVRSGADYCRHRFAFTLRVAPLGLSYQECFLPYHVPVDLRLCAQAELGGEPASLLACKPASLRLAIATSDWRALALPYAECAIEKAEQDMHKL